MYKYEVQSVGTVSEIVRAAISGNSCLGISLIYRPPFSIPPQAHMVISPVDNIRERSSLVVGQTKVVLWSEREGQIIVELIAC